MSQTHISIRDNDIKNIAYNVRDLQKKGKASHIQTLNAISQGLWGKNYEEAKETLIEPNAAEPQASEQAVPASESNQVPTVHILHYGDETIVTHNKEYVTGDFPGTDLESGMDQIHAMANYIASSDDDIKEVQLPHILSDGFETDDIIDLAQRLGYFQYHRPLFEVFSESVAVEVMGVTDEQEKEVLKGGFLTPIEDLFWDELYQEPHVNWDDVFRNTVFAEFAPEGGTLEQSLLLSLEDIGNAKQHKKDGQLWIVDTGAFPGYAKNLCVIKPIY